MRIQRTPATTPSIAALVLPVLLAVGCAPVAPKPAASPVVPALTQAAQAAISPAAALERLREGNARFVAGTPLRRDLRAQVVATAGGQYPFASVLGCIDSRVPPELVFDQGIGDVFSARIAGNFVDPALLGSLEFASKVAGSKLIFVLGHTECGAIQGACDGVELGNITKTLSHLRPAVAAVRNVPGARNSTNKAFVTAVTHANVKLTMQAIRAQSPILDGMISRGEVGLGGGVYDLATGVVEIVE
jgi:carbonic anhydrase